MAVSVRIERVHHVHLTGPPGCEAQARWFYGELLGLRELPKPPELAERRGVWFLAPNCEVHVGVEDPKLLVRSRRHVCFEVDDLDEARVILLSNGIAVQELPPQPGVRRFFCRDPFGNQIEFVSSEDAARRAEALGQAASLAE